jgi:WD40 repeat protein
VANPYKGLQAFQEKDAGNFHGRTNLITHLTNQLSTHPITQPTNYATKNFLALVGPSGSGKSSVVGAGLVPALRHGALPNSENWFITNMMPSTHPYDELETALLRVAVNPPPTLLDQLRTDERGLLRAVRRILPDRDSQLLLVIDQFEELFTLTATPADTNAFLDTLVATVTDPRSPVSVVLTLRADFFDRPLHHPAFGELMRRNTEVITPMSAEELIQAIRFPAEQVGAQIEPALLTQIITDVNDQPGALPLLQYALTELFERRQGNLLTKGAYQEIGGVLGALGRRAEEIYNNLDKPEQATAKQLFLRLVTLGEGVEDTRRRVLQSELESLINQQPATSNQQPTAKSKILNAFGSARLLSFDRDPDTRHATVEVAHEALLREWSRLRGWLADSREDIRLQRQLAMAGKEWRNSEQDDSFLLRGARLDRFEGWARQTSIALNQQEKAFLEASLAERIARHTAEENRRQQELATAQRLAETEKARAIEAENRATEQAGYAHTLRRRAYGLAGVLGVAMLLAIAALFFGNRANQNATLAQQAQATSVAEADFRATAEGDALLNADLAATRAVEAENSASLAETREAEAVLAQAQAQDEANVRATAEAIAILERENAEEQTRLTRSREMSLAALNNIKTHAELSVLLALQALNVAHTKEAEDTLHQAVINSQIRLRLEGHGNPMAEIMFSPDGSQIAGISWRFTEERSYGTMYVWDAVTGEEVWSLDSLGYAANQIDYSPDSQILVVTTEETSSGGLVKFFNAKTGEFIRSLDIMPAGIHSETAGTALWVAPQGLSVEFSPDGQRLVVSHFDLEKLSATVFDLETGESLFSLPGHGNSEGGDPFWQEGPTYSPDGKYIAGAGTNGTIYLWDSNSGEVVLLIETANRDWTDFAVSTDGLELFTIGQRSNVTYLSLWDIATGELILEKGLGDGSANIAISPDESLLAVGIRNENVYLLDAQNLEKKQELVGDNTLDWNDFDFSPDGTQLVGKAENGVVLVWDILPKEILTLYHGGNVSAVAYSPTGVLIATADSIGVLKIWDSTTGQKLQEIEAHFDWLGDIDFAPDGSRLATAGDDYMAKIWDVATGELLLTLEGHTDWVNRLSFSPDGKQLTTAGADGTIRIWDSETGKLLYLIDDVNAGWSVAYSADGRRIVTGFASQFDNLGNAVKIWDSESGELLVELEGSVRGTTTGVQFTSDGEQVVAGGVFGNVFVWNSHTGEKLRSIEIGKQIIEVKLHENDKHIIIGTVEGTVEIWDMETGERLVTLFNQGSSGHQFLELSPNGKHVLSGGVLDGMVRVLTTDLAELEGIARSRLTRGFTEAECRQFNITPCPTNQ